ncbi:LPS export ABC transporter periplasmic protein LptC [Gilliamella sp. B2923]|uniref:LPS export ABC transporter periplasmic protein LptC n=1 Tax=unclassified Gilliamella TaxID=2685620 RepID=UPI00226ACFC0|nr:MULTISPECIES: LPS export ABC transporter periplasmic protein LptC [unclassified Gilliamella]MCX8616993.1 LPS export ABC transporter periplasmic protein LptC [Gilliamella sp. B2923]MCX8638704.1 LPS export ABC transporter periplasmic protein LptC [Gilliamella sp. B3172]
MNKKNIICLLLLIVVIGVYYNYQKGDETKVLQSTANLSDTPIYQSDNMVTNVYNLEGEIVYKIESGKVKHFDSSEVTEFDLPNVTLYDQENSATWHITAQRAALTNDKKIYLYSDVQLTNLTPDAQLQKVLTDNAVIDLTTQLVTSKDPITIKGVGYYSTGLGLAGDLQAKTAKILENVKTYYHTEAE